MSATPSLLPADADPSLGPILSGLTACLCASLADGGRPACACCLVWGDGPPAQDFCSCDCDGGHGQAWVRVVRQEAVPSRQRQTRCLAWRMQTVIELGVARCVAVVAADDQSAPTCEQREADAWGLVLDMRLLRQAVACCDVLNDRTSGVQVMPGPVTPTGPRGGCAGVTMQITVEA